MSGGGLCYGPTVYASYSRCVESLGGCQLFFILYGYITVTYLYFGKLLTSGIIISLFRLTEKWRDGLIGIEQVFEKICWFGVIRNPSD